MIHRAIFKHAKNYSTMKKKINFYSQIKQYGEFSNFHRAEVEINGALWPTTEHYFQAQKFPDNPEIIKMIQEAETPSVAKRLGGSRQFPLRPDWESVKDGVMMDALRAKFTQHRNLKAMLLQTGDAYLNEHTRNDSYWADGGDGTGKNRLGMLLMKLRAELQEDDKSDWDLCE
ncbi:hypothetical protein HDV01_003292 [Terramyces sp. JEL0728]|nr:hypothetical protein HDV01_003292 [Terramyces sp. JEL0728]